MKTNSDAFLTQDEVLCFFLWSKPISSGIKTNIFLDEIEIKPSASAAEAANSTRNDSKTNKNCAFLMLVNPAAQCTLYICHPETDHKRFNFSNKPRPPQPAGAITIAGH